MKYFILVFLGGGVGSVFCFFFGKFLNIIEFGFFYGIFVVNIIGSLFIGFLLGYVFKNEIIF